MKKIIFLILIFFPVVSSAFTTTRENVDEKLEKGGIIKSVIIPSGQDMAYVNVSAVINAPINAVWKKLTDINTWSGWLPTSRNAHFLSEKAASQITPEIAKDQAKVKEIDHANPPDKNSPHQSGHWIKMAYEEYDLPWPIHNEWVVRNYVFDETNETKHASWKKVATPDGKEDGFWDITRWGENKTLLKYYYRVKAKEKVPEPIFKTAVSFTINSMIKALRRETASSQTQAVN